MAEPFYWNLQPCNVTHINVLKLYFHVLMREQTLKIRLKNHFVVRNLGKKKKHLKAKGKRRIDPFSNN